MLEDWRGKQEQCRTTLIDPCSILYLARNFRFLRLRENIFLGGVPSFSLSVIHMKQCVASISLNETAHFYFFLFLSPWSETHFGGLVPTPRRALQARTTLGASEGGGGGGPFIVLCSCRVSWQVDCGRTTSSVYICICTHIYIYI